MQVRKTCVGKKRDACMAMMIMPSHHKRLVERLVER